jgi:hypothetical protein
MEGMHNQLNVRELMADPWILDRSETAPTIAAVRAAR